MAELLRTMLRMFLVLLAIGCVSAKRYTIMAPNVFHIGVEERVSVTVFDAGQPVTVKFYLQDYPHRRKTFSEVKAVLQPQKGRNTFLRVKVRPEDLPDRTNSVDKQYVYLVAKSDDAHFQFHKEAKILLSYKDGMVFIQTDKPIYIPRQTVRIRVIPVDLDMKPSKGKISVVVTNPQGIRVQQWNDLQTSTGIISKAIDLSDLGNGTLGKWTITAFYGHQDFHKTSVQFEVKEYVLPKFSVKLSVPPYILETDQNVKVTITARYTYKEPVVGAVDVRFCIETFNGHVIPLATHHFLLDASGAANAKIPLSSIQDLEGGYWFPEKAKLLVKADVMEQTTGNKETAVDRSCLFTSSPYIVEYKNTQKYFKPGLPFVVKVIVTYPNKQPAGSVPMKISATGIHGSERRDLKMINHLSYDRTNENGEAEFVVDPARDFQKVVITVKTDNQTLTVSQNAVAVFTADAFHSKNAPMIMLRQHTIGKVGSRMFVEAYRRTSSDYTVPLFSYVVVSRGRILSHNTVSSFNGVVKTLTLHVTSEMFPSARLIGYYLDNNGRVVADSILLRSEENFPTQVNFPDANQALANGTQVKLNEIEKFPGIYYVLRIQAPPGTRLGLLGVDESVYLLKNENRLTKERALKTAKELDLGCGAGGGKDSAEIFQNSGVVIMTDSFVSDGRNSYSCHGDGLRKRRFLDDLSPSDDEILDQMVMQRSYFPETWVYDEMVVGPSGLVTLHVTIPDTITTWVMQAVAINNQTGLGLATPLRIVSKKDFFVSLKMPYSVKRGEQVSILVTVFNYLNEELRAKIDLMGDSDFCSIAADGKRALIGQVVVPARDARSVAVSIVPKRLGEIEIKVSAILQIKLQKSWVNSAGDAVRRKLLVVAGPGSNNTCKFDLYTTVTEVKGQKTGSERVEGCKGKHKDKKKCRRREKKEEKDKVESVLLKVCTRKKVQGDTRGLSIMDIGILNGFIPERKSLEKLKQNNTVPELDKFEVSERSLVMYLKKIPRDRELCIDVQFDRQNFFDGKVQAVPVNVYDYYEPDQSCSVFYGPVLSPLKLGVCDAGSNSCKCIEEPKIIGCDQLLRNLLKNPPRNTRVSINVRLSKARYRCRVGYVLSGNEMRTCKDGRWSEEEEPKCIDKRSCKEQYVVCKVHFDYSTCGESPVHAKTLPSGRKIRSRRGWWPWQVAIYRRQVQLGKVNELYHCGGALISRQWVLTAANCFYQRTISSKNPTLYAIKAGVHNLAKREESEQKMLLTAIYVHKKFNSTTFLNDIALVKLDRPVKLTNFVRTVCLQEKTEQDLAIPETYGIVPGWGITKALKIGQPFDKKDLSNVLHYSSLKIQNDQFCLNRATPYFLNTTVAFCAGDGQRRSGTCTGDGGGVFVSEIQRDNSKRRAWVATGIVSWGKGCAQKDEPGYYTKVYPFIEWIKKIMNKN